MPPAGAIRRAGAFAPPEKIMMRKQTAVLALPLAACAALAAAADDKQPSAAAKVPAEKSIRMDEPMTTEMMKPGMMKSDVKNVAEKKDKAMKPMMEMEEKSMPGDKGKP